MVRGFLVRKRAVVAFCSMESHFRAQTAAKTQKAYQSFDKDNKFISRFGPESLL